MYLVHLVRTHKPKIMLISETRQCDDKIKNLRRRLDIKHCKTQQGVRKKSFYPVVRGTSMFWSENNPLASSGEVPLCMESPKQRRDIVCGPCLAESNPAPLNLGLCWVTSTKRCGNMSTNLKQKDLKGECKTSYRFCPSATCMT